MARGTHFQKSLSFNTRITDSRWGGRCKLPQKNLNENITGSQILLLQDGKEKPPEDMNSECETGPCASQAHANRANMVVIGVITVIMVVIIISIINFIEGLLSTAFSLSLKDLGSGGVLPG